MSRARQVTETQAGEGAKTAAAFTITTLQQAMRAAWVGAYRGLASQGWQRAATGAGAGACCFWRYNGRCCAVGWLIPDAAIATRVKVTDSGVIVSGSVGSLPGDLLLLAEPLATWACGASSAERWAFIEMLGDLQAAHDNAKDGDGLRAAIEEVGRRFNLGPLPTLPVAS